MAKYKAGKFSFVLDQESADAITYLQDEKLIRVADFLRNNLKSFAKQLRETEWMHEDTD